MATSASGRSLLQSNDLAHEAANRRNQPAERREDGPPERKQDRREERHDDVGREDQRRTSSEGDVFRIRRRPASIFDYEFEDFEFLDYHPHEAIRAPIAV